MYCKKCGKETEKDQMICSQCAPKKKQSILRIIVISILTVIVFMIMFVVFFLPPGGSAREPIRRISCRSNLKQIGLSLKEYADDYELFFPDKDGSAGLEQLRADDYLTDYGVYTCPSTVTNSGEAGPLTRDVCDYIYIGGFKKLVGTNGKQRDIPLVFDSPGNHENFINVFFLNGSIQGIKTDKVKNCKDLINYLNKIYKYDPAVFNKLMQKADKLDKLYGLK
jgi:predicted nucleic acid-binding Zn ribbon protein